MSGARTISLAVNGEAVTETVALRKNLVDFLRDDLGLTGSHVGCEHGVCGACTLEVNGQMVRGCLMLAVQADGAQVVTVEGLADSGRGAALRQAFANRNALQCGFCTPGMIMRAIDLVNTEPELDNQKVREGLEGNICRCTGYHNIVKAVLLASNAMQASK